MSGMLGKVLGAGVAAAGLNKLAGDYSDLGQDIANQTQAMAAEAQAGTQFKPFTVVSNTGNTSVGQDGSINHALGGTQQGLVNQANAAQGAALGGINNQYLHGITDTQNHLGVQSANQAVGFLNQAGQPADAREQDVYNRLRAVQSPEEERARLQMEGRMFQQGRSGIRSDAYGGTPEQLALEKAIAESKNTSALQAIQQAQGEQLQDTQIAQSLFNQSFLPQTQGQGFNSNQIQQAQMLAELGLLPESALSSILSMGVNTSDLAQTGQIAGHNLASQLGLGGLQTQLNSELVGANLQGVGMMALANMANNIGGYEGGSSGLIKDIEDWF